MRHSGQNIARTTKKFNPGMRLSARNDSLGQRPHMRRDRPRRRQPDAPAMRGDMGERAPEMPQAMGLADDVRMQRDAHDERLMRTLFQHFVKMVDDHLRKSGAFDFARD